MAELEGTIFTQPTQEEVVEEEANLRDYANVFNSFAMPILNKDTRVTSSMYQDDFSWAEHKDYLKALSVEDQELVLDRARSIEHADLLLQRRAIQKESQDRINNDPTWQKIAIGLPTAVADPTILVPGSIGLKIWKAGSSMNRMLKAGTQVGLAGATANVVSESMFDVQGLEPDYTSAALYGFVLGGGIGALGEGISRSLYKNSLISNLQSRELENTLDIDTNIVQQADGTVQALGNIGRVEEVNPIIAPSILKSDVMKLYESSSEKARNYISRLFPSTIATKDAEGKAVVQGLTADDMKQKWKGKINQSRVNIGLAYRDAKVDGYIGDMDSFLNDAGTELKRLMSEQERAAYAYAESFNDYVKVRDGEEVPVLHPQATKKFNKRLEEYYTNNPVDVRTNNPQLTKAVQEQVKYYKDMLETGQRMSIKEFSNINPNKLYMPRVYDWGRIREADSVELSNTIREAILAHPGNKDLASNTNNLNEIIEDLTTKLKDVDKTQEFVDFSYIVPKELPFQSHLKAKKVKLDDNVMSKYLMTNSDDVMGLYHYKQSGIMGIQYAFGTTDLAKIQEDIIAPIRTEVDPEELGRISEALENTLQDTIGTLRIPKNGNSLGWRTSRLLSQWNAMTMGGSFGLNTVSEIPVALMATESKGMFFRKFLPLLTESTRLLFKKDKSSDKFINELVSMGNLQTLFDLHGMNRVADTDGVLSASKIEHGAMKLTDTLFKFNGLRGVTATLEAVVGGNAVTDIHTLGKMERISTKQAERLSRWGLSHDDAKRFSSMLDEKATFNKGVFQNLNIEQWDEADLDILQSAISRAIHSGVIQADTVHMPNWMLVPGPVRKLTMQFLRFPIAAQEILLRRGWQEDKAGLVASALGSMMAYASVTYLREQASIASGLTDPIDAKYDIVNDGEEAWIRLFGKSTNYAASIGALTIPLTYGAALTGQPEIGKEYANSPYSVFGPSVGRVETMKNIFQPIFEGQVDNRRQWYSLKSTVPFTSAPIISEGLNEIINSNTY